MTRNRLILRSPFFSTEPLNHNATILPAVDFTFEAGNALLKAALIRQDERMLLEVQGVDMIIRKVLYHTSCYGSCTHKKTLQKLAKIEVEAENAAPIQGSFHL